MRDLTNPVWYLAYGSNLDRARFLSYLQGGRPPGAIRHHHGARNPSPPLRDRPAVVEHPLYFAGASRTWTGGTAFLAHEPAQGTVTYGRAYLITAEQFLDVFAQENGSVRPPLDADDLASRATGDVVGSRYGRLQRLGRLDGLPLMTFASPRPPAVTPVSAPSIHYLRRFAEGLRQCTDLDDAGIAAYLAAIPGASTVWSAKAILAGVTRPPTSR